MNLNEAATLLRSRDSGMALPAQPDDLSYVAELQPSEWTAAMLRAIKARCSGLTMPRVLDMGVGSGVLLCALARLGAQELWGVDIYPRAVAAARFLLNAEAGGRPVNIVLGDLWTALPESMEFDVIVANLPQFPSPVPPPGRPLAWSYGDGRGIYDRLLAGLRPRLAPGGMALVSHGDLLDPAATEAALGLHGLVASEIWRWTLFECRERVSSITPDRLATVGNALCWYGGYAFTEARILEIRGIPDPAAA